MKNILVIGSYNVDRIIKLSRLPEKGETIGGGIVSRADGGKGANQAVAAIRAGGNVTFSSCLGNDYTADSKIMKYKMEGIDTKYIFKIDKEETGSAFILVDERGENMIAVAQGANGKFSREYVDKILPAIHNADFILLQFEIPLDTIKYILTLASRNNKKVILNPAPALKIEHECLKMVHVLVANQTEAALLAGIQQVRTLEQVKEAAKILSSLGPKAVIITMGSNGSYVIREDKTDEVIPAFKVNAVDATAAGDTYCGALAVALAQDKSIKEAILFATAAAAITVTRMGAQTSIPKNQEIMQFLVTNR
jgi:ribokinase